MWRPMSLSFPYEEELVRAFVWGSGSISSYHFEERSSAVVTEPNTLRL